MIDIMQEVTEHYGSKVPKLFGAIAITFGKHIFYRESAVNVHPRLRRHELEHVYQYQAYGFYGFLKKYLIEYIQGRMRGLSHYQAYAMISFECQAREAENAIYGNR